MHGLWALTQNCTVPIRIRQNRFKIKHCKMKTCDESWLLSHDKTVATDRLLWSVHWTCSWDTKGQPSRRIAQSFCRYSTKTSVIHHSTLKHYVSHFLSVNTSCARVLYTDHTTFLVCSFKMIYAEESGTAVLFSAQRSKRCMYNGHFKCLGLQ